MVGLETTGSLLTHCTYALGFHPEVQERLHAELCKIGVVEQAGDKQRWTFAYDALTSCQYLDAVISETLRMLSPVISIERLSSTQYTFDKYNITIPRDTTLLLDYHGVQSDPDYWPDPFKFDPNRFMSDNKTNIVPGSYTPFGVGPRHCIGMRFSLTESKLALAKLVATYRFDPAPGTTFPPATKMKWLTNLNIKHPIVQLSHRAEC